MAPRTNQCFGHLPSAVGVASFPPQLTAMYACQKRLRRRGPRPWAPVLDIRAVPTGQEPLRELLHSDQTAGSRSTRQQVRLIHSNDRQHLLPAWVAFALIESNDGRYVHWLRWRLIPYASLLCPRILQEHPGAPMPTRGSPACPTQQPTFNCIRAARRTN